MWLIVAWGFDSGWEAVRRLLPSLGRGAIAAGIAVLTALPLQRAIFGTDADFNVLTGLGSMAIGGLTALGVFLLVSYLLRAPELQDLTKRG